MGARPSSFKKPGGFLNNVDGAIVKIVFTPLFYNAKEGKRVANKPSAKPAYYGELHFQEDGKPTVTIKSLYAGLLSEVNISKDEKSITPVGGAVIPWGGTELAAFVGGAIAAAPKLEASLPEDDQPVSYVAFEGQRFHVEQQASGRKDKDGNLRVRHDKKNDKDWPETFTVPTKYLGAGTTGARVNGGATKVTAPVAAADEDFDVAAYTEQLLNGILQGAKNNELPFGEIGLALTKAARSKPEYRDLVVDFGTDINNLLAMTSITVDREGKRKMVSLTA